MTVLSRSLLDDTISLNCKLKLSKFVPYGLENMIKNEVPEGNHIIGVTYKNGDSQICISGHIKEGEKMSDGCVREMSEEIFLRPRNSVVEYGKERNNHFYIFNIKDLQFCCMKAVEDGTDTRERAVMCVHGKEFDIYNYMKRLKLPGYTNDTIINVWTADKRSILGAIYAIRKNRKGDNFIY
jgi:hypothetical protein